MLNKVSLLFQSDSRYLTDATPYLMEIYDLSLGQIQIGGWSLKININPRNIGSSVIFDFSTKFSGSTATTVLNITKGENYQKITVQRLDTMKVVELMYLKSERDLIYFEASEEFFTKQDVGKFINLLIRAE